MKTATDSHVYQDLNLSKDNVAFLANVAFEHAGIWIDTSREYFFYQRLLKRVHALNLSGFDEYCDVLKNNEDQELRQFINAITTSVTSFFREDIHFDFMVNTIIPKLMDENRDTHKIRIWSAGCSSGEEAYSIAMVMIESIPELKNWDVKILATDINSQSLSIGKIGVYNDHSVELVSPSRKSRFFLRGKYERAGFVLVKSEVKDLVHFKYLNLIEPWPFKDKFDCIFCRNVIIYIKKETQIKIFAKFSDHLKMGGYIMIGQAETLNEVSDDFVLIKNSIYMKQP